MHELWVCKNILNIIEQHAKKANNRHIKKVYLEVGQLAAIDHHSLKMSFHVLSKGTSADRASLEIIEIPAQAVCDSCHQTSTLKHYCDRCQHCGNHKLTIVQGEELRVKSMEIV